MMRRLLFAGLNNLFTVERRERTSDGQGGFVLSYVEIICVRGRIRPASGREREVAASEEREISHILYVLAGTDIERGDRVTCDDLTVDVMGIREPSLAGQHYEIDCMERQQEAAV